MQKTQIHLKMLFEIVCVISFFLLVFGGAITTVVCASNHCFLGRSIAEIISLIFGCIFTILICKIKPAFLNKIVPRILSKYTLLTFLISTLFYYLSLILFITCLINSAFTGDPLIITLLFSSLICCLFFIIFRVFFRFLCVIQ